ncbi:MAG: MFS transporter [Oscillospiraceae bacterium]|nr:MFS transporter [Oscillospiraceae bacterium]
MAKLMSEETKAQVKQAVRHPGVWWRGADLPEEKIHPWEGGIQFLAEALKGFMNGFTDIRGRLYIGMSEGKIQPNMKSVSDVLTTSWDALIDFPVGIFMDRKRFGETVLRWIMRFNATFSPLFILIQCFNFGLTPTQRLIEWTLISMFANVMSSVNAVSETKIWAGITPYADERKILQLSRTLGGHVGGVFSGATFILMGLKDILGITDYQIMIWGAMIFAPLTIFSRWLPSYAKQRVDLTVKVEGEEQREEVNNFSFRESFSIVKHNTWFMMWLVVYAIRIIRPSTDELFLYRFLMPKLQFRGKELGGEILYTIKGIVTLLPGFLLSPLAIKAVNFFKGEINFIKGHVITIMIMRATVYFVGYNSPARIVYMFIMEMLKGVMDMWAGVPHSMMEYKMYDYVEWKTGYRSEGMTKSVDGILNKLIRNNLVNIFGNAVTQWTGYMGYDIPAEQQPARFLNTIWPLMHVGIFFGEVVVLVCLFAFKMPNNFPEIEADLIERRALAAKLKEEAGA